jgi:predicted enzyme related to lactoylglutathione lyase
VKYVHTNIVARDWRRLADFYQNVFAMKPVPPERHHHGAWVEALTGVADAVVRGIHLRMPGYGDDGPTLEIFGYNHAADGPPPAINRPGLAHLAFHVEDVPAARAAVLAAGGRDLGQLVTSKVPGAGTIELIYMTDPEGNIIELQHWSK